MRFKNSSDDLELHTRPFSCPFQVRFFVQLYSS